MLVFLVTARVRQAHDQIIEDEGEDLEAKYPVELSFPVDTSNVTVVNHNDDGEDDRVDIQSGWGRVVAPRAGIGLLEKGGQAQQESYETSYKVKACQGTVDIELVRVDE